MTNIRCRYCNAIIDILGHECIKKSKIKWKTERNRRCKTDKEITPNSRKDKKINFTTIKKLNYKEK